MAVSVSFEINSKELAALQEGRITPAIARALRKAGSTALRDMRSEASKRIRRRKKISAKYIRRAIHLRRPKIANSRLEGTWALDFSGTPVPLVAYPHKQTALPKGPKEKRRARAGGVRVEVNRGKRTLIKSAFVATMKSGHKGIWVRKGAKRLPIMEKLGSRPVDAMLHKGEAEAVAARGAASMGATFDRVLPLELGKGSKGKG